VYNPSVVTECQNPCLYFLEFRSDVAVSNDTRRIASLHPNSNYSNSNSYLRRRELDNFWCLICLG
ncbi:MAG: hypothetical protein M3146_04885, partial [Thermoproteota archaeon]|nr:hypothetical protein [Thermoproteota archaeon]